MVVDAVFRSCSPLEEARWVFGERAARGVELIVFDFEVMRDFFCFSTELKNFLRNLGSI